MPPAAAGPQPDLASARHPELARYLLERAIRHGTFKLASGRTASYYCDGKQVSFAPEGAALVADAILAEVAGLGIDAIGGMDMGATPIVAAVAMRSHQVGHSLPSFVVRKEMKGHGTQKQIEGLAPEAPARVAIVDDVVTTAGSIIKAIDVAREAGLEVVLALSILDRAEGGREALEAHGCRYQPLVTISELGITPREECAVAFYPSAR